MKPNFEERAAVDQSNRLLTSLRDHIPYCETVDDVRRAIGVMGRTMDALDQLLELRPAAEERAPVELVRAVTP